MTSLSSAAPQPHQSDLDRRVPCTVAAIAESQGGQSCHIRIKRGETDFAQRDCEGVVQPERFHLRACELQKGRVD